MTHNIDILGCGVIYIDKERVFGSKPYGLFSTVNWKATDEDLKRIADRCLEVIADRKTEPSGYKVQPVEDEPKTSRENTRDSRDNHEIAKDEPQTDCAWK